MTAPLITKNDLDQIHEMITKKCEQEVECHLGVRPDKNDVLTHDVNRFCEDADDVDTYNFTDLANRGNAIDALHLTRTTGLILDVYVWDAEEGWAIDVLNPEWNGTDWTL